MSNNNAGFETSALNFSAVYRSTGSGHARHGGHPKAQKHPHPKHKKVQHQHHIHEKPNRDVEHQPF